MEDSDNSGPAAPGIMSEEHVKQLKAKVADLRAGLARGLGFSPEIDDEAVRTLAARLLAAELSHQHDYEQKRQLALDGLEGLLSPWDARLWRHFRENLELRRSRSTPAEFA